MHRFPKPDFKCFGKVQGSIPYPIFGGDMKGILSIAAFFALCTFGIGAIAVVYFIIAIITHAFGGIF